MNKFTIICYSTYYDIVVITMYIITKVCLFTYAWTIHHNECAREINNVVYYYIISLIILIDNIPRYISVAIIKSFYYIMHVQ